MNTPVTSDHFPNRMSRDNPRLRTRKIVRGFRPGVSLAELLISLSISALLLTATMAATDACFKAYSDAAEQFSTQAATRMVTTRLLSLVRNSTAHGPLAADATSNPPATLAGNTITSPYVEMIDPQDKLIRIEYHTDTLELWMTRSELDGTNSKTQPLLSGVTAAQFSCIRRRNSSGQWELLRATMDLTIQPGQDTTLQMGHPTVDPIRVIGSTKPRRTQQ